MNALSFRKKKRHGDFKSLNDHSRLSYEGGVLLFLIFITPVIPVAIMKADIVKKEPINPTRAKSPAIRPDTASAEFARVLKRFQNSFQNLHDENIIEALRLN